MGSPAASADNKNALPRNGTIASRPSNNIGRENFRRTLPVSITFAGFSAQLHIFEAILDGDRPTLNPESAERDADLYHVIELAWQSEPEQRPSVQ
uniref:Uncharacterized protein n=1 Tax=Globisporangium ultimum (strain ATCC 200006 / CBS 805.95 / DAOM BR144) TaxID=431595 RepID=K3W5N9_GLOUD